MPIKKVNNKTENNKKIELNIYSTKKVFLKLDNNLKYPQKNSKRR